MTTPIKRRVFDEVYRVRSALVDYHNGFTARERIRIAVLAEKYRGRKPIGYRPSGQPTRRG